MPGERPLDAVEWVQPAEDGGTQSQVFRLADGRITVVKFLENSQGPRVLFNEFVSCRLAELLKLPVNRAVLVRVDEELLARPKKESKCAAGFKGGVHCGLIRYADAAKTDPSSDLFKKTKNAAELDGVLVLEQLVVRGDGRQLLIYPAANPEHFAAYDFGFAFGGSPAWTKESVGAIPAPQLPTGNALGEQYADGALQREVIDRLRKLTATDIEAVIDALELPRWGVSKEEGAAIAQAVTTRTAHLVRLYDERYPPKPGDRTGADPLGSDTRGAQ